MFPSHFPATFQASGLRVLHKDVSGLLGDGVSVIAATTGSRGVAEGTRIPLAPDVTDFHMPRYSLVRATMYMHVMYTGMFLMYIGWLTHAA